MDKYNLLFNPVDKLQGNHFHLYTGWYYCTIHLLNNWGLVPTGGYSGFQVTGMIGGFFWVWNFRLRDFFGYENLASIFLGSLIWVVKSFVLFLPELVLFRVIHNVTVETKPFLDVSCTRSSLLKWLPDEGKDIIIQMVWWIKKHECSISNVFLCVIALPLSGTFKGHKIGMGFFGG